MKNILLSTLIIASLFIGTTTISAQTKSKSDATVINNDTKVKPVTKVADQKVTTTPVNVTNTTTNKNVVAVPSSGNSKAISPKKILKKVNKKSTVATPVVNKSDIKKE